MSLPKPSATPSGKSLAASALRGAGLIDRDSTMHDVTDNAGGRKGRTRSTRTTRLLDFNKDRPLATRTVNITTHFVHPWQEEHCCNHLLGPVAISSSFPARNTW